MNNQKNIAERLSKLKIDLIYSSPYLRTKQTVEIISHKIKKSIEYWEDLIEVDLPKETFDEINKKIKSTRSSYFSSQESNCPLRNSRNNDRGDIAKMIS